MRQSLEMVFETKLGQRSEGKQRKWKVENNSKNASLEHDNGAQ